MTREVRAFAITVLALAVLGLPAGLLWSALSPRPPYQVIERTPTLADPSTQALIAADGWFATVTGALGLACGTLAWFLSRRVQLPVLLGLALGGAAGAFAAFWAGTTFTVGVVAVEAAAAPGVAFLPGPLTLTAKGVLVSWPLLATGVFGFLEGMHGYRESPLRRPHPPAGTTAPPPGPTPPG
ncbi:hypothetical protein OUY22_17395 [Nonomuraea sp. MCN248]|uniref:DUF2567 domain-containing protein n=1 Tax=Nonomuraea corallina TaxID=2989783 RepID=A0ABT4SDB4_9ACTN|nr:hypothetical protein [Nonomuraea corallina]MDA0635197.1 hypothetical protein [Nonomuraea corallina]